MLHLYPTSRLILRLTAHPRQLQRSLSPGHWLAFLLALAPIGPVLAQTTTFLYTGDTQTYMVPAETTHLQVVAIGAGGGRFDASASYSSGAQVNATLSVTPGETLFIVIGGKGKGGQPINTGGFNGGGGGSGSAGGGGGATELRRAMTLTITDDYLRSRNALVVAGGGGGSDGGTAVGGAGGTPIGGNGIANNVGIGGGGATQTAAGGTGGLAGTTNQGGDGNLGGGGGGGYYGGGGGAPSNGSAGGGGGSSWVTPVGSSTISYTQSPTAGSDGSLSLTPVTIPLPVQLIDFTTQLQGTAVVLAWHTASEVNSARFEVERSVEGTLFTKLGAVTAHGTTSQAQAYAYRDAQLPNGAHLLYYRLRQVDLDGMATYSPVRTVAVAIGGLSVFPNPTATGAILSGTAAGTTVRVLDTVGRDIFTTVADAAGTAILTLPTTLPSGVYLVRAGQQMVRLTVK